jgi:hypothetical protein
MIINNISTEIRDKLGGDFYTSGMTVFGNKKLEGLITYSTTVNKRKFAVSMNYDAQINL